ncbi:hypothetical protein BDZ89DRAFT_1146377 [Hymenopellis radicata]|nr:hypothetical protein BDZ89DRAFT_1146377 [Hymenopellis radicata]
MVAVPVKNSPARSHSSGKPHPDFCDADADLTVRSSDGDIFRIHTINVKANTTSFPLPSSDEKDGDSLVDPDADVVSRYESKVLVILFKYLYPQPPHPDLADLSVNDLKDVAYAAQTQNPINVRRVSVMAADVIEKHSIEILKYAVSFLDKAQIDKIALQTLATKVEDALKELDSRVFKAWVLHRELWTRCHPPTTTYSTQYYALKHKSPTKDLLFSDCLERLTKGEFGDEDKHG